MSVFVFGQKNNVCKICVIYAIGHFLRFKTKEGLRRLRISVLKRKVLVSQKITRIKLNARLVGVYFHKATAFFIKKLYAFFYAAETVNSLLKSGVIVDFPYIGGI